MPQSRKDTKEYVDIKPFKIPKECLINFKMTP